MNPVGPKTIRVTVLALLIGVAASGSAYAVDYAIDWSTFDGGGCILDTSGAYSIGGTIGQAEAGPVLAAGEFTLEGGFWTLPAYWGQDLDFDGDVDLRDFMTFQACFNGPNQPPRVAGCDRADFDQDNDVDLKDFMEFQACFNGPNRWPACR